LQPSSATGFTGLNKRESGRFDIKEIGRRLEYGVTSGAVTGVLTQAANALQSKSDSERKIEDSADKNKEFFQKSVKNLAAVAGKATNSYRQDWKELTNGNKAAGLSLIARGVADMVMAGGALLASAKTVKGAFKAVTQKKIQSVNVKAVSQKFSSLNNNVNNKSHPTNKRH
jgi:fructose-1,6-bisphosphatase/inositol monophosphatase family enzyme